MERSIRLRDDPAGVARPFATPARVLPVNHRAVDGLIRLRPHNAVMRSVNAARQFGEVVPFGPFARAGGAEQAGLVQGKGKCPLVGEGERLA